jgi:hypothetical protein
MRAVFVVVANVFREQTFQMAVLNCNDVIQEITPATPYPTLCNSILPRTFERGADSTHPSGSDRCGDFQSILGVTIKDDEPRSGSQMDASRNCWTQEDSLEAIEANAFLRLGPTPASFDEVGFLAANRKVRI